MLSPREAAEKGFIVAASDAALFELRVRLRAGAIPGGGRKAIGTDLSKVVKCVTEHYELRMDANEIELLERACSLRNKVLHCEFSSARAILELGGGLPGSGGVTRIRVTPGNALETLELLKGGG